MQESHDKGKEGEEFVSELAETAYLKYWCYPNSLDINGNGKEICDFLILFYDTAIIISVKNYNLGGNFERFRRKVIEKSSKQLVGAQRKIKRSQTLTLLNEMQGTVIIDTKSIKKFFSITVSVGENYEDYMFVDGDDQKGIINIFNKDTADTIFKELDTIKDLVNYLVARENLLYANKNVACNCIEKDLLAHFLMNAREFHENLIKDFPKATSDLKGKWEVYMGNKAVIRKKLENEKSYFTDKLVKNDVLPLKNGEMLAKEFMSMSRFERRIMANNLFELVDKHKDESDFLARRYTEHNGVAFLFIYYPIERSQQEIDQILLYAQQLYTYYKNARRLVLLAACKDLKQWKFGLYLPTIVCGEGIKYLEKLRASLGWLTNEVKTEGWVKEYPEEE